jgi:8-oxo-dGTP diphosphatase
MSKEAPSSDKPKVRGPLIVTAAVIRDGDRVLIARRPKDAKIEAGKWEFPGGKLEFGETPEQCIVREIEEELGVTIAPLWLIDAASHVYRDEKQHLHIVLLCYLAKLVKGAPRAIEVAEVKWVNSAEFAKHDFATADLPFLSRVTELLSNS